MGKDLSISDELLTAMDLTRDQYLQMRRQLSLDMSGIQADESGQYAWDRWERRAIAARVEEELAQLGRAVMRKAVQHDWSSKLKRECGWEDEGQRMLELALHQPQNARTRWQFLLDTDGHRVRKNPPLEP